MFANVTVPLLKENFVIHEAIRVEGVPENQVKSFNYKVSFLGKDAFPIQNQKEVWVTGGVMNSLITHQYKRLKFVYDETITVKEGWICRGRSLM